MQEHQLKALTTSQTNNTKLTKEVKKLRLNLQGKNEWMSLTQYMTTLQIKSRKGSNNLVHQLKTMPGSQFEMRILGEDKFPSCCFNIEFLEEQTTFIEKYFGGF